RSLSFSPQLSFPPNHRCDPRLHRHLFWVRSQERPPGEVAVSVITRRVDRSRHVVRVRVGKLSTPPFRSEVLTKSSLRRRGRTPTERQRNTTPAGPRDHAQVAAPWVVDPTESLGAVAPSPASRSGAAASEPTCRGSSPHSSAASLSLAPHRSPRAALAPAPHHVARTTSPAPRRRRTASAQLAVAAPRSVARTTAAAERHSLRRLAPSARSEQVARIARIDAEGGEGRAETLARDRHARRHAPIEIEQ